MAIPRRKKVAFEYLFDWTFSLFPWSVVNRLVQLSRSLLLFSVILFPVFIDTLIWIFAIVVGAGNMIVAGLYEAHIDYRIVKYVQQMQQSTRLADRTATGVQKELLVTITSGNLLLPQGDADPSPQEKILESLDLSDDGNGHEKSRSRLLNLLDAQSSFGSAVGSPVLFYLGAFLYTILDLLNNPSSQDAAISLGFGIEWMIIVHVAIISGCALASNNPSTSAGIVGARHKALREPDRPNRANTLPAQPTQGAAHRRRSRTWRWFARKILGWSDTYGTEFQPVTLWGRGINKMACVERTDAWQRPEFRRTMEITAWGWFFKILGPALVLIVLPPATGGVVAYFTPPRGIACRSLSFLLYASCQVAVTLLATVRNAGWALASRRAFRAASAPFWVGSLLAAVLGTTMQVVGVYRNCICYSTASAWRRIWAVNPAVNLASDTQDARDSSRYWVWMGATASVFMALNCYVGWWYQRLVRKRFTEAVADMAEQPQATAAGGGRASREGVGGSLGAWMSGGSGESGAPLIQGDGPAAWAEDAEDAIGAVQPDDIALVRRRSTFAALS
ncbi:hypothetical protein NKR23_g2664 [Pleurostoma richardsiae]|uniref:Uncharacterized protein n=1 Tax=Pleurostoma richardsiae TaxID=41990 RepID=A0AA38RN55_9PEZI|nr:hypothetical protein NKR23_g2664 [Pleurostoma richardsiae]